MSYILTTDQLERCKQLVDRGEFASIAEAIDFALGLLTEPTETDEEVNEVRRLLDEGREDVAAGRTLTLEEFESRRAAHRAKLIRS